MTIFSHRSRHRRILMTATSAVRRPTPSTALVDKKGRLGVAWHRAWDQGQLPESSFHPGPPGPCFLLIKDKITQLDYKEPRPSSTSSMRTRGVDAPAVTPIRE